MKREELSKEKREEYDALVDEMMKKIEEECSQLNKEGLCLDGEQTKVYQRVTQEYLPKLNSILSEIPTNI